jgi:hypothetical protein
MQFKYNCDPNDVIVQELSSIIELLKPKPINVSISDGDLDKILSQYYVDFMLDKCEDIKIGFTEQERISFRNNIKNIIKDIVNKNIPKDFLIKG